MGSHLNSVLPLGEVDLLLLLLVGLRGSLVLGEPAAEGAGELGAEVKREELLVLVEEAELRALVGVDDGEDTSDRLADVVAVIVSILSNLWCIAPILSNLRLRSLSLLFSSLSLSGLSYIVLSPFIHATPLMILLPQIRRYRPCGRGIKKVVVSHTSSGSSPKHHQQSSGHGAGSGRT